MANLKETFAKGFFKDNPIFIQILGICSALAVTNLMLNSLIMGIGLIFVTAFSEMTVSLIRNRTPKHIRMMIQTFIISFYVILLDIFLKAYMPAMSRALGPYVGLIITNCIIMGRCEAFAQNNTAKDAFIDGIAYGGGYAFVLLLISFVRELLGFGTLFGYTVMPAGFVPWTLMVMPPAAFFLLAIIIWVAKNILPKEENSEGAKTA
ncbi:Na+-transporting NADH:ubiquinone oxidoreductase subunit D [Acetoanaerobium pronyense]|uniref:Na+-transporting NADH:ubiquinone oxidoreductase subunit D n=1 Tax=Acetoanaerobium pronyense TaxID=1482736 RepID=A0ABS4KLM4_9FIRM|nr:NADH:ubiquinone reductase (Na(+)-transporting) subunit D [Acetoanaerobium pronyense]MBP2028245.1 Na+-transporting NADH:ubiquinone oxidoreductase subunit D [Acetoanaerobium pronyense]